MEKVKRFVDAHVIYYQSSLVEELLSKELIINDCIYSDDNEVLEWWLATSWLANKLQENGEVVIEEFNCRWWGGNVQDKLYISIRSCTIYALFVINDW